MGVGSDRAIITISSHRALDLGDLDQTQALVGLFSSLDF